MSIRRSLAIFFCMVMAMALVWSKALLAISSVMLAFIAATDIQVQPFKIRWLLTPSLFKNSILNKPYIMVIGLFTLLYVVSIVYAGNVKEWWALTHMKIDFLLIPLSFAILKPFTRKEYMIVTLSMVVMAVWSSVLVQIFYFQDYYLFSKSLGFGGALPTPTHHIRYSIIIALSMVICLAFVIENFTLKYKWERWVYGVLAAYLFYFLHILSVRSGLALGYAGILILCLFYIRRLVLWKRLALIGLVLLAPFLAYKTLHGFQEKINYTIWDFRQFIKGQGSHYSDSERWQSMRAGIEIGNRNPIFGVGTGHFRPALKEYYKTEFNKDSYTRPHNQFINVYTCFGLFGLAVFTFMMIYPMTFRLFWSAPLMPTLYIMQFLSLLVEHPLDTALGTSLFLLMSVMGLSYQEGENVRNVRT